MSSPGLLSDYAAVQDYLFGLKAKGVKFGIDRMRALAREIGHPERTLPIIHIAGTNGKGSTCAMVEEILRGTGRRVGLYTSPHLVRLGERVQVNRAILTEDEIVAYTRELQPLAEMLSQADPDDHPSFFEFMTAMAFLQFQRRQCDVGIAEVGLGGELDATNVVQPAVTAITSIGFDHCEMLGNSHEEIARAKAGIIKPGVPVVMGRLPAEAEAVIAARARELGCRLHGVRAEYGERIDHYPRPGMDGDCQRWNAATATLTVKALAWSIPESQIQRGLRDAKWPARWEHRLVDQREIILDSSHNPEGAVELALNLARLVETKRRKPIVVVGALGAARAGPLIEAVSQFAREIHIVVPAQSRACGFEVLREMIPTTFQGPVHHSMVEELFGEAKVANWSTAQDTVVVTGSIYLAGEVLTRLDPAKNAGEGHLQDF